MENSTGQDMAASNKNGRAQTSFANVARLDLVLEFEIPTHVKDF